MLILKLCSILSLYVNMSEDSLFKSHPLEAFCLDRHMPHLAA